jgi:hypothetical protein
MGDGGTILSKTGLRLFDRNLFHGAPVVGWINMAKKPKIEIEEVPDAADLGCFRPSLSNTRT